MTCLLAATLLSVPLTVAPVCTQSPSVRAALSARLGASRAFVFCAPHDEPIRRVQPLMATWVAQAGRPALTASCRPGQFFTFQIGVLARRDIRAMALRFTGLRGLRRTIPAADGRCISLGGIDFHGKAFRKALALPAGRLQPLWCGWDVPTSAQGVYRGFAVLTLKPGGVQRIPLTLHVLGRPMRDHGADDPAALTRLRWLDSTAGQGHSIPAPFRPVTLDRRTIHVLGRDLVIGSDGLPAAILSHFSAANTRIESSVKPILAQPFRFTVASAGRDHVLSGDLTRIACAPDRATWRANGAVGGFSAEVTGTLDFTGSGRVTIRLRALRDEDVDDIRLDVPYTHRAATYMMGLNRKGGLRPASHQWKWDVARHQDCFWLGAVDGGLMVRLKGSNYHRPLVNIYYKFNPLAMPDTWGNRGAGGVDVFERDHAVVVRAYSGKRRVRKGETLDFIADVYLTPFRPIDTDRQWATRFIHPHPGRDPKALDDALALADPKSGPNVVNIHQASYYNPYINYPYSPDSFGALKRFVAQAHAKGVRARVYYTTREITQNMPEFYALHALNGEVIFPGPGKDAKTLINPNGPTPWLTQNLGSDFIPAWVDHVGGKYAADDISVITTPDSRWNNFYLRGLKWMVDRAKIDGIYIDDTALDAGSLLRARRILAARPDAIIDLHSWNHFNEFAGYANNLNMYMEVLPYLDRLWLGEGFDAKQAPWDYWLVEMSGLPFGLMSEMLDDPDPVRGLVFGETARLGWSGDPRPIWKLFDQYGFKGSEMLPFFDRRCPVHTGRPDVLATVYRSRGQSVFAIGNWSGATQSVTLQVDWKSLGLKPATAELFAPAIEGVQTAQALPSDRPLAIPPGGLILVLRRRTR